jgi:hypothetical protein
MSEYQPWSENNRSMGNFTFQSRNDTIEEQAEVAQLVEQLIRNQQVVGSTPIFGSSFILFQKSRNLEWLPVYEAIVLRISRNRTCQASCPIVSICLRN